MERTSAITPQCRHPPNTLPQPSVPPPQPLSRSVRLAPRPASPPCLFVRPTPPSPQPRARGGRGEQILGGTRRGGGWLSEVRVREGAGRTPGGPRSAWRARSSRARAASKSSGPPARLASTPPARQHGPPPLPPAQHAPASAPQSFPPERLPARLASTSRGRGPARWRRACRGEESDAGHTPVTHCAAWGRPACGRGPPGEPAGRHGRVQPAAAVRARPCVLACAREGRGDGGKRRVWGWGARAWVDVGARQMLRRACRGVGVRARSARWRYSPDALIHRSNVRTENGAGHSFW